ncbi:MAG: SDR family oxidoreductase [Acidobacteriaceae bacterium]|nr:SDR family oxidoreductase [Acidobacteriaceae bacterium]
MILITGASGNVGKEVLKQIAQTGAQVRAAFQSPQKASAPPAVDIAIVDFNRPETLRNALKDVDHVFLVGPPTEQLPALERKAVDVFAQANIEHLVKLSAMGGREATFPRQHAESEDYIRSSGVPYTFLRPNGFMQNMVNYNAPTITTQDAFYGSEGDGRVSQIDIRDVAAVAVKTLTEAGHVGKTYTLTGPEALTNTEVAQILSRELGREIRYVNLPPEQLKQALLSAGLPEWNADALLDLQRLYREGKAATVTRDVEQLLGREPINYKQFARDYRDAFQARRQAAT